MEKARLTREQAEALERRKEEHKTDYGYLVDVHRRHSYEDDQYVALNEMDTDTFCRALYVGYEVIEEDQVIVVTPELRKEIQDYFVERQNDDREWMVGWRRGYKDALALLGIKA